MYDYIINNLDQAAKMWSESGVVTGQTVAVCAAEILPSCSALCSIKIIIVPGYLNTLSLQRAAGSNMYTV